MDELLRETRRAPISEVIEKVRAVCKLLEDHKGGDVTAIDLRELHLWTDFFVITTVSSGAHLQGILRHIKEYAGNQGLIIQRQTQREESGGWHIVDMGAVVIHLMTAQSREFYELEKLWDSALRIYPSKKSPDHSSKSS